MLIIYSIVLIRAPCSFIMYSLVSYEKFRSDLYLLLTLGESPTEEYNLLIDFISNSKNASDVFILVEGLKDESNDLFKKGKYEETLEKYGYAGIILARNVFEEKDRISFCDLAFRILLNSVACFGKTNEYNQVGLTCFVVLEFEPKNVKALFWTVSVSIEVGKVDWAYWDLFAASEIDPIIKEVSKELERVKLLLSNLQSKDHKNDPKPIGLGLCLPNRSSPKGVRK